MKNLKNLTAAALIFLLGDIATAFCGPSKPLIGKFEVDSITREEIACEGPQSGKLKLSGCSLTFFDLSAKPGKSKKIRLYGNIELCNLKNRDTIEMWIGRQCCDQLGPILCKEYPDGRFDKQPDGEIACKMDTPYYVFQYKILRDGKPIIRIYNSEKMIFEDSDAKTFQPISKRASKKR